MNALTTRFQRSRWSKTRCRIDALQLGQSATFPMTERNNAVTTIQRLRDAYEGARHFTSRQTAKRIRVTRTN